MLKSCKTIYCRFGQFIPTPALPGSGSRIRFEGLISARPRRTPLNLPFVSRCKDTANEWNLQIFQHLSMHQRHCLHAILTLLPRHSCIASTPFLHCFHAIFTKHPLYSYFSPNVCLCSGNSPPQTGFFMETFCVHWL